MYLIDSTFFPLQSKLNGGTFSLGERISKAEAEQLLMYQLKNDYMPVMARAIPTWGRMNSNQRGAVLSFGYNLGAHFYGGKNFATITRVLGDPSQWQSQIRSALILYRNPGSNVEAGLLRRRNAEADVFLRAVSANLQGDEYVDLGDTLGDHPTAVDENESLTAGAIFGIVLSVIILCLVILLS